MTTTVRNNNKMGSLVTMFVVTVALFFIVLVGFDAYFLIIWNKI
jgi:hypothetical protein